MRIHLFFFLLLVMLFLTSCRKTSITFDRMPLTVEVAQQYYQKQIASADTSKLSVYDRQRNPQIVFGKRVDWGKAQTVKWRGKEAIIIPIRYENKYLIFNSGIGYDADRVSKLVVYKDATNKLQARIITVHPVANAVNGSTRVGFIEVETITGMLVELLKIDIDGNAQQLDIAKWVQHLESKSQNAILPNSSITVCYEISGYNYSPITGETTYWTYSLGCQTYFFDEMEALDEDPAADDYLDIWGSGGGGGGAGVFNESLMPVVEESKNPIGDINDYIKCFTNSPGADYSYKVKLCVAQPTPGTRDTWSFVQGEPIFVGHTFLVLTQTKPATSITRNVGFYPGGDVTPFAPSSTGILGNDENAAYDIAVEVTVTSSQFTALLDFIQESTISGTVYNLNTSNCTTFALNAFSAIGVQFPRTAGTWPNGAGLNPADLGEDLRTMVTGAGMTKSIGNSAHPNSGSCY